MFPNHITNLYHVSLTFYCMLYKKFFQQGRIGDEEPVHKFSFFNLKTCLTAAKINTWTGDEVTD